MLIIAEFTIGTGHTCQGGKRRNANGEMTDPVNKHVGLL